MNKICSTRPTVSITLPAVKSVNWTGLSPERVDVTSFDWAGWKQYVSGLKDAGSLEITMAWPNADGAMTTWSCSGLVTRSTESPGETLTITLSRKRARKKPRTVPSSDSDFKNTNKEGP